MTVTLKNARPLVVPPAIQRRAGITSADQVEFRAAGGVITITAKPPSADDEYTPEQLRIIDARLAKAGTLRRCGRATAATFAESASLENHEVRFIPRGNTALHFSVRA